MSETNFSDYGFEETILEALDKLSYHSPTKVQQQIIPLVLEGKDVIVKAKTGSGKTAAFAIPICDRIELENRSAQVLVLTPTRELAVQVKEDIAFIGRFKKIRCAAVYGRQPITVQQRELKQRVHVIVATPGRMIDHIRRGNVDLKEIKYLVLDEADEMLNMGFIEQVETIISSLPKERMTLLFSATMPSKIERICQQHMVNPIRIEVESKDTLEEYVEQVYYETSVARKSTLLNDIICVTRPERCIIFCNTREVVEEIVRVLHGKSYSAIGLHGGMEQDVRLSTIQRFKRGHYRYLVATDVAARGIHIDDISHVINYDMPFEKENYVHRIGRTGRAGNGGMAISLVTGRDTIMFKEIEAFTKCNLQKKMSPSIEAVEEGRRIIESSKKVNIVVKPDRSDTMNKEITRIRINAGKKKKLRPGDILGALSNIEGITGDDIGIIDIQNTCSYVEIFGGKGEHVYKVLQETKIKGKTVTVKKVQHKDY